MKVSVANRAADDESLGSSTALAYWDSSSVSSHTTSERQVWIIAKGKWDYRRLVAHRKSWMHDTAAQADLGP